MIGPSGTNSLRDPRSVRPTAAARCAKVRSVSDRLATPKVAGQMRYLLMWSGRLTVPRPPRTCHNVTDPGPQEDLRRFRDGARNRWPLRGSSRSRRHEQPQASNLRWPTRGGTPYGPGPGRGVCALPLRATGRRCWNASWVGTPYGPGRDEVSASPSQRCAVEDVGAAAPPLHADVLLHSSA